MFKKLINAWRSANILDTMYDNFDKMLVHTHWMFGRACDVLSSKISSEDVADPLYKRDKQVNQLERSIRRKIVRHLAVSQRDLPACLILMSVVKDAERIGDYCKNVFEVGMFFTREFTSKQFQPPLGQIQQDVDKLFDLSRKAFVQNSNAAAEKVIQDNKAIGKRCDMLIQQLLGEREQIGTDEAVAYSLLARHFKRVGAHLANVCTATVAPLHMLDYHDEQLEPPKMTGGSKDSRPS